MLALFHLGCIAATILSTVHVVNGSPTPQLLPSTNTAGKLFTRALDGYDDCSDDQKEKLGRGFADAATLARWTGDHEIDLESTACVLLLINEIVKLTVNM